MKTLPNENAFAATDVSDGLTKREYFAAMAMQGFCAAGYGDFKDSFQDHIAQLSVKQANAIIAELNKQEVSNEAL